MKDLGDKVDSKEKEEIENLIKDLKEKLTKDNIEDIKKAKDTLQEKAMAMATKLYEQNAKSEKEENSQTDGNVKEADVKED